METEGSVRKVIAFVPIKFESQRLENKNFLSLGDHPLCYHIFETLLKIEAIDKVYVYCSKAEIMNFVPDGVELMLRPEKLDQSQTLGIEIYQEFAKAIQADIYVLAHATSPLLTVSSLSSGLNSVLHSNYDSSFSVVESKTYAWYKGVPLNYQLNQVVRTQDLDPILLETSGFYIYKKEVLEKGNRIGEKSFPITLSKIEAIDIDQYEDYVLAQAILSSKTQKKIDPPRTLTMTEWFRMTNNIKLIVFDYDGCMSDGSIYLDHKGNVIKNYYTLDGESIVRTIKKNYKIGIMSGNDLRFFKKKAKKWGLAFLKGNISDKLLNLKYISYNYNIPLKEIAFFGDGLNDMKVLQEVGFSGCPSNAHPNVKKIVKFVSTKEGGKGAIREFLNLFP